MDTSKLVNRLPFDITVENLISLLIQESPSRYKKEDFVIHSTGKEGNRKEIQSIESEYSQTEGKDLFHVQIARDGLLDSLPTGLFLVPEEQKDEKTYSEQREEARLFFMPFDNAITQAKIEIICQEQQRHNYLLTALQKCWGLPTYLSSQQLQALYYLLPFASSIVGNKIKTAQCLEALIHFPVEIKEVPPLQYFLPEQDKKELGEAALGIDTILGSYTTDGIPAWEIQINTVNPEQLNDFLHEGVTKKLIKEVFIPYFVPMVISTSFKVNITKHKTNFILTNSSNAGILGYTTKI